MCIHLYVYTCLLISWNPNINRGCTNLDQLVVSQICISFEEVDAPTVSSAEVATAPVPTNLAHGTNTRCAEYHQASTNETCSIITTKMGISLTDFYFLNPRVNSTSCDNLAPGESYCVKAVGDVNTYPGYGGISQAKRHFQRNYCQLVFGNYHLANGHLLGISIGHGCDQYVHERAHVYHSSCCIRDGIQLCAVRAVLRPRSQQAQYCEYI